MLNNVLLLKGAGMGSSTPQEGGTTDEEYYGQPVTNDDYCINFTAPNKKSYKITSPFPVKLFQWLTAKHFWLLIKLIDGIVNLLLHF